jgi:hypothetical protein
MIWVATEDEYMAAGMEGRSAVGVSWVHGASSPDFPSPPVEPVSRVSVRWAAGRTQVYIGC